jgi:hypothetical protein
MITSLVTYTFHSDIFNKTLTAHNEQTAKQYKQQLIDSENIAIIFSEILSKYPYVSLSIDDTGKINGAFLQESSDNGFYQAIIKHISESNDHSFIDEYQKNYDSLDNRLFISLEDFWILFRYNLSSVLATEDDWYAFIKKNIVETKKKFPELYEHNRANNMFNYDRFSELVKTYIMDRMDKVIKGKWFCEI